MLTFAKLTFDSTKYFHNSFVQPLLPARGDACLIFKTGVD